VRRMLFLGSSCIYPRNSPQPIREDYLLTGPLEPTNRPYALAKIAGIEMCWAYNRQYGTQYLSVMPTNLFGPGDNYDLETKTPPPAWTAFRTAVKSMNAILFVTPEYNRSMPGAVKNALDVGSRPWGDSAWSGKPGAVISLTPGALGAMAANHHLRQVMYAVNLAAMPYPEYTDPGRPGRLSQPGGQACP